MKTRLVILLVALLTGTLFTQQPYDFYGGSMGIQDFNKFRDGFRSFYNYLNDKNFEKALEIAEEAVKTYPDIGNGYKMRFRIGMAKHDLSLVKESLISLEEKYFF